MEMLCWWSEEKCHAHKSTLRRFLSLYCTLKLCWSIWYFKLSSKTLCSSSADFWFAKNCNGSYAGIDPSKSLVAISTLYLWFTILIFPIFSTLIYLSIIYHLSSIVYHLNYITLYFYEADSENIQEFWGKAIKKPPNRRDFNKPWVHQRTAKWMAILDQEGCQGVSLKGRVQGCGELWEGDLDSKDSLHRSQLWEIL